VRASVPSSNRTDGFPVYGFPVRLAHCREHQGLANVPPIPCVVPTGNALHLYHVPLVLTGAGTIRACEQFDDSACPFPYSRVPSHRLEFHQASSATMNSFHSFHSITSHFLFDLWPLTTASVLAFAPLYLAADSERSPVVISSASLPYRP
jgi:hypothetical protein